MNNHQNHHNYISKNIYHPDIFGSNSPLVNFQEKCKPCSHDPSGWLDEPRSWVFFYAFVASNCGLDLFFFSRCNENSGLRHFHDLFLDGISKIHNTSYDAICKMVAFGCFAIMNSDINNKARPLLDTWKKLPNCQPYHLQNRNQKPHAKSGRNVQPQSCVLFSFRSLFPLEVSGEVSMLYMKMESQ